MIYYILYLKDLRAVYSIMVPRTWVRIYIRNTLQFRITQALKNEWQRGGLSSLPNFGKLYTTTTTEHAYLTSLKNSLGISMSSLWYISCWNHYSTHISKCVAYYTYMLSFDCHMYPQFFPCFSFSSLIRLGFLPCVLTIMLVYSFWNIWYYNLQYKFYYPVVCRFVRQLMKCDVIQLCWNHQKIWIHVFANTHHHNHFFPLSARENKLPTSYFSHLFLSSL